MTIGERIKAIRRSLDLTQTEFATRIGSVQNTVTGYENGRRNPSAPVVSLICREFNVSEAWLRTGEGEMFAARSHEDELAATVNNLLSSEKPEFRRRLILALSGLSDAQWDYLESFLQGVLEANSAEEPPEDTRDWRDKHPSEWTDQDEETAVAEFRQQFRDEKNRRKDTESAGGASAG